MTDKVTDDSTRRKTDEASATRSMVVEVGNGLLLAAVGDGDSMEMTVGRHWQCEPVDALSRLEDAVYEQPTLFDDVATTLLLAPTATTVVPRELVGDDDDAIAAVLDRYDLSEAKDCFAEPIGDADDNMLLYTLPAGMRGFLERCFPTEKVSHRLLPFLRCFMASASAEGGDRMWADIHDKRVDVAAFRDGHLLLANTWHWHASSDILYYLVYCWRTLALDSGSGQLCVSGDASVRNSLLPELRKYINYVAMPSLPRNVKNALSTGLPLNMVKAVIDMADGAGRKIN